MSLPLSSEVVYSRFGALIVGREYFLLGPSVVKGRLLGRCRRPYRGDIADLILSAGDNSPLLMFCPEYYLLNVIPVEEDMGYE